MNYPVLQGLDHDDVQDAYGPLFGIPVTRADLPRRQDLRTSTSGLSSKDGSSRRSRRCSDRVVPARV